MYWLPQLSEPYFGVVALLVLACWWDAHKRQR
jgi:hypothetical protein